MGFSEVLNDRLGDESGRSVCLRTTHGFKIMFGLDDMSDKNAERIVHGVMLIGIGAIGSVVLWYILGKRRD